MDESGVKAYIELGQAAIRRGEVRLYRLWLMARACDVSGRGRLDLAELEAYTADFMSLQTLRRVLKLGAGSWWMLDTRGRVWLAGLKAVREHLNTELHAHPVYIPLEYLKRLADFGAACVAAMMAGKPRTISQAKLAELYGKSARTVSAYVKRAERRGLLTVTPQAAITNLTPGAQAHKAMADLGYFIVRVNGKPYVAKRMPNRYSSQLCTARFGAVKQYGKTSSTTMRATYRRLYYAHDSKGLTRAIASLYPGEAVFIGGAGISDDGRELWYMYERPAKGEAAERV